MDDLLNIAIRGIGLGSVYALVAISLNLIFRATGVANFAQGQLLVVAGIMTSIWLPRDAAAGSVGWWGALMLVAAAIVVIAGIQGLVTLVPLRSGNDAHSWIITTLAASVILGALIMLYMGPVTVVVPNHFGTFDAFGSSIPTVYPVLLALAVTVYLLLDLFQRKTLVGLALSGLAQDPDAARTAGAPTLRIQVLAFCMAGLITAVTAFLGGHVIELSEAQALHYVLFAFIVMVLGGVGNQTGALISGPVFGVVLFYTAFELGGGVQLPTALAVIVVVLMVRPQGIFGRPQARRV